MSRLAPSFEDYYDLTTVRPVAVSPDGRRIAFVATERDAAADELRSSILVVPADGSAEPHRLTRASGARAPAWSPDGTRLGFIAEREADAGRRVGPDEDDENGAGSDRDPEPQVRAFDPAREAERRAVDPNPSGDATTGLIPDLSRNIIQM